MPDPAPGDPVLVDDVDRVRRITLNRPEVRNALTSRCYELLAAALQSAADDPAVACVSVTGADGAFTAGLDLKDRELPLEEQWAVYESFIHALEGFSKPLIAAVNGLAIGIGVTMLGHFDLVFAANSSRFRLPFAPLGLGPEAGSTLTLPMIMGTQATAHAMYTATWISAEEAAASGLVWKVVPDLELDTVVGETCAEIAQMPIASLVATKQLLLATRLEAARAARAREEAEFRRLQKGPDHAEALAAFAERRAPVFHR